MRKGARDEALAILSELMAGKETDPEIVGWSCLDSLNIHTDAGRFEQSKALVAKAGSLPLTPPQIGTKYLLEYNLASKLGDFSTALQKGNQAVAYLEEHLEESGEALLGYAIMKRATMMQLDQALHAHKRAFELLVAGDAEPEHRLFCLSMIGIAHQSDADSAQAYFDAARKIATEEEVERVWLSRVEGWNAVSLYYALRYEEALEHLKRIEIDAVPLTERPINHDLESVCYAIIGDYFESLLSAQRSLLIAEQLQGKTRVQSCQALAIAYLHIGDYSRALHYSELALSYIKENDPNWQNSKANNYLEEAYKYLASCHTANGNKEAALECYRKAIAVMERKELSPTHLGYYKIWLDLAGLHPDERGLEYGRKGLATNQDMKSGIRIKMGDAHHGLGNLDKAIGSYLAALEELLPDGLSFQIDDDELLHQFQNYRDASDAIRKIAEVLYQQFLQQEKEALINEAIKHFEYALELETWIRKGIDTKSQMWLNDHMADDYASYLKILKEDRNGDKNKILRLFELCKADVLHQSLIEKQTQETFKGLARVQEERARKTKIRKLEQRREQTSDPQEKYAILEEFLQERKAFKEFVSRIEEEHPDYANAKYQVNKIQLQKLQTSLAEGEKMLNYLLTEKEIFILYIGQEEAELVVVEKPKDLREMVEKLRQSIITLDKQEYEHIAQTLYSVLISAIEDCLFDLFSEEVTNLNIIPHGYLTQVPFETLFREMLDGRPNYLINNFNISYHYSTSIWAKSHEQKEMRGTGMLGIAPVYDQPLPRPNADGDEFIDHDLDWASLPFSLEEVEQIAKLFENTKQEAQILIREEATKEELISKCGQVQYLHIAAHFHQHEIPQRSGLVLGDGRYLFIDDTYRLRLQADLIVLSACESGIGTLMKSEGMLAISRGLLYAGASNIISTLFKINDLLANELMQQLYQYILAGNSITYSLSEAKRQFAKDKDIPINIWAAFTLIG